MESTWLKQLSRTFHNVSVAIHNIEVYIQRICRRDEDKIDDHDRSQALHWQVHFRRPTQLCTLSLIPTYVSPRISSI